MTDTKTQTYTRADVEFLGEHPMDGPFTTANRYKVGENFYLILRNRVNALQNEALAKAGFGYDKSYDEHTQMDVVLTDQHTRRPWDSICKPFTSEDEEDGIKAMLDHANGIEAGAVALLEEGLGAIDLTTNPIGAEAQDAARAIVETDPATDPVVDQAEPEDELGPDTTISPDDTSGNAEDTQDE